MNFTSDLIEQIRNTFYVISVFPNVLISIFLVVFIIYSIYKLKPQAIFENKYFWIFLVSFILFPIIILSFGIEASNNHFTFDENRSFFIKETFFIHLFFFLNIAFVVFIILKSKEVRLFYISSGIFNLWISLICWGFSLLIICNNVFI